MIVIIQTPYNDLFAFINLLLLLLGYLGSFLVGVAFT